MICEPRRIITSIHRRHTVGHTGRSFALATALTASFVLSASAQVTYVDATAGGNTTLLDGTAWAPTSATALDGLWRARPGFGHGGTIAEANANGPENAHMLLTTISGLTPGENYNIYAYFWSNVATTLQDWKLKATTNAASIDDNGTIGNVLDDFLPTDAALSFSKLGSLSPVATNAPAIATGFDGTDNLGVAFDAAGLSLGYFNTPTKLKQPAPDNSLAMFQADLGLAIADGSGQVKVYIDDLENQPVGGNTRTWYDGVGYALPGLPTLTINRDTGEMVFTTGVERDIISYSIRSASGTLNQDNWTTITGNYDDDGDGTVDDNDNWLVLTNPDSVSDLSEAEFGVTGPMDGASLEPGTEIDFGTPWRQYFVEDVTMQILLNDVEGTVENVLVVYEGNGDFSFLEGDFNFDGDIDPLDYSIFIGSLFDDITGSVVEAYALGDLTGDIAVGYDDLVEFRDIYDAANGAGAFQALATGVTVPEPQSIALVICLGALLLVHNRKRVASFAFASNGRSVARAAGVIGMLVLASVASAQTTYVDATETPGGNTTLLDGTDFTAIAANANDGLWRERAFGNGDTIFEANAAGSPGENAHMLQTTITGLVPGAEYYIYSYFWSNPLENWRLKATIDPLDINDNETPGDLTDDFLGNDPSVAFSANGSPTTTTAPLAKANHFATPTLIRDLDVNPNILLYEAALGTIQADGGGQVQVYMDDLENQTSAQLRTFYDGVGFERVLPLTLRVNTTTGATSLLNEAGAPINFNFYEITSASNSLNVAGWNSLDLQNIDAVDGTDIGDDAGDSQLEGWDGAGGSDDGQLGEVNFLSSSTLANLSSYSLGNAFEIGGTEDLVLTFEIGGRLRTGIVVYVEGIPGDYDSNGIVEAADYTEWKSLFGTTNPDADGNGDNKVNAADYVVWRDHLGQTSSGSGGGSNVGAIPEPSAVLLSLTAAMFGGFVLFLRGSKLTQLKSISVRTAATMGVLVAMAGSEVQAEVRNDREYWFGEDSLEGASHNIVVGSNNTPPLAAGNSADSIGPSSGSFLDLTQSGDPLYNDVGSGGLNRPGAGVGTLGVRFDGVDDHLTGVALNRPDELATLVPGYPINYTGITARGLQMWVYPTAATIGTRRQTIVMDTVAAGGVAITADGRWHQINDGHFDEDDITSYVPVVGDQWYHVMHHVYHSNDFGAPAVLPGTGTADLGFTGVIYVNGIAVSASNDTPNVGDSIIGSRVGVLVVGAEELADTTMSDTPIIGNYFDGVIDDLEMYVYGDNTLQGGENYGTFDLFADNAWIADQIAALPGGALMNGDLNRDGEVTLADRDDFVDGWLSQKVFDGAHNSVTVGDWETWTWGDMDHDGQVFLKDAFIMHRALMQSGLGGLDFSLLGAGKEVPEPSAGLLLATACGIAFAGYRLRK